MILQSSVFGLLGVLLWCASAGVSVADESQAVVLMYHHFGVDEYPSTNTRLEQFESHLAYLAEAGYQVWPLAKVVDFVRSGKPFPGRVVAITVDDAYRSVFSEAYPRLRKRGWPFTVFVATDGVDRHFRAYMTWQQMREMQAHGASFENHSASHDFLIRRLANETDDQWRVRVTADVERAQRRIQEELGKAPTLFAYPYGEYDGPLAGVVNGLGLVAFGQQSGPVGLQADIRALPRFPMGERFAGLDGFRQKLKSRAFPVMSMQPWDPRVSSTAAPRWEVQLADSDARLDQLSCFFSGGGTMTVEWLDRATRRFAVQASGALPQGRSRYNCTAPSSQPGRYFWLSHLWIVL